MEKLTKTNKFSICVVSCLLVELLLRQFISTDIVGIEIQNGSINFTILFAKLILYVAVILLWYIVFEIKDKYEIKYVMIITDLAFILGWIGYLKYYYESLSMYQMGNVVYNTIKLFSLSVVSDDGLNIFLNLARFLAIISASGVVLIVFARENVEKLIIRLKYHKHIVVCADEIDKDVKNIIEAYSDKKIVIVTNTTEEVDEKNIRVLRGHITTKKILGANAVNAEEIFLMCKDEEKNIDLAFDLYSANKFLEKQKTKENQIKTICHISVVNEELLNILNKNDIFGKSHDSFDARFFVLEKTVAKFIVYNNNPYKILTEGIENKESLISTIGVVGEGIIFREIVMQLIKQYTYGFNNQKIDLYIFSEAVFFGEATLEKLSSIINIHFEDISRLVEYELDVLYIASKNDYMQHSIYQELLQKHKFEKIKKVVFGYNYGKYLKEMLISLNKTEGVTENLYNKFVNVGGDSIKYNYPELEANAVLVNEAYQNAIAKRENNNTNTYINWNDLSESAKESNRLATINYEVIRLYCQNNNIDIHDEKILNNFLIKEHNRWYVEKVFNGYIYGDEKCEERLINKSFLLWKDVSKEDKELNKDMLLEYLKLKNHKN